MRRVLMAVMFIFVGVFVLAVAAHHGQVWAGSYSQGYDAGQQAYHEGDTPDDIDIPDDVNARKYKRGLEKGYQDAFEDDTDGDGDDAGDNGSGSD